MTSWKDFDLIQLVVLPMFLFSATFYPLDVYPDALRPLVRISPLYHGTELIRELVLGHVHAATLAHVAVLVVMAVVGLMIAHRRLSRLLLT
jgi:lipooligosaccharide transport system permease protein